LALVETSLLLFPIVNVGILEVGELVAHLTEVGDHLDGEQVAQARHLLLHDSFGRRLVERLLVRHACVPRLL
jgi:hypothetical protein